MKPPTPDFQSLPPSSPRRSRGGRAVSRQGGQILLAALLIMVVVTMIVLSIATRTITNLRITSQTEQSQRAFSAAEAGIEQGLKTLTLGTTSFSVEPNLSAQYTVTGLTTYELYVPKNEVAQVCISLNSCPVGTATSVDIYWVKSSNTSETAPQASIVVYIYSASGTISNLFYCDGSNTLFGSALCTTGVTRISTTGYSQGIRIALGASPSLLRIRPISNGTSISVRPTSGTLATQAHEIQSAGTSSGGNPIVRKIKVVRALPTIPAVFDYGLYSGGDISK